MPYNKGDFTQQGVNGDVSALVRLNEKRVMKVVLSSDDESDNCDISGKVYDLLNGTSYDIGSGGGGGGDEMLKTTLTVTNNTDQAIILSDLFLWAGYYLIKANIIDNTYPPYLLADQNQPYDIISLIGSHTIASGTTYTVDLYYVCDISDTPLFGLMASKLDNVTLVNMSYVDDPGAYTVINTSESSSITVIVTGK